MKSFNIFLLLALSCINSLDAQQDTIQKIRLYRTWVSTYSEPSQIEGVLYQLKDSSILVSSSMKKRDYLTDNFSMIELHIDDIEIIKIRRNNSAIKGAVIMSLTGFTFGLIYGLAEFEDDWMSPRELQALTIGIGIAAIGYWSGYLFGSIKRAFHINRRQFIYSQRDKAILSKYSLLKD